MQKWSTILWAAPAIVLVTTLSLSALAVNKVLCRLKRSSAASFVEVDSET